MGAGRIDAVLLDMGGILVPVVSSYDRAANDAGLVARLRSSGIEDPVRLAREAGERVWKSYRASPIQQPDPQQALAELDPDVRRALLRAFARLATQPPYSFARAVVAALADRYALGLVSNNIIPGDHHARSLERAGILGHFDAALWSANFGTKKPNPAMLECALSRLGVPAHRAVMLGDQLRTDVAAARRAGVRSIWLRRDARPQPGEPTPDFVIQDLRQLPQLLRRLDRGGGSSTQAAPSSRTRSTK
jgi:FMN phosphatase YigB (HAD superfamily)